MLLLFLLSLAIWCALFQWDCKSKKDTHKKQINSGVAICVERSKVLYEDLAHSSFLLCVLHKIKSTKNTRAVVAEESEYEEVKFIHIWSHTFGVGEEDEQQQHKEERWKTFSFEVIYQLVTNSFVISYHVHL